MKKQGFTLIELMVVIVIMGILAAVAVPKLFGMIAKSKASEVGPAAGTYVKLQQAYFSESSKAGGWQLIGYLAPSGVAASQTTNFKYDVGGIKADASDAVTDKKIGWQAANVANLNECQGDGTKFNWKVEVQKVSGTSQDDITFTSTAIGAGCIALTPTFDKIGK